jgi:hypothetical protein
MGLLEALFWLLFLGAVVLAILIVGAVTMIMVHDAREERRHARQLAPRDYTAKGKKRRQATGRSPASTPDQVQHDVTRRADFTHA